MEFPTAQQTAQLDAIKSALAADSDPVLNELGRAITPLQLILLVNAIDRARGDKAGTIDMAELLADHSGLSDDLEVAQDMGLFRHLSETEAAEFRQWAWDNWTPGDDIADGISPGSGGRVPIDQGRRRCMGNAKPGEIFIAIGTATADRADSDNYWGSFEHAGRVFDLCAYWTGGTLAVVVYNCVNKG